MQYITIKHQASNNVVVLSSEQIELSGLLSSMFNFTKQDELILEAMSSYTFIKCMAYLQNCKPNMKEDIWSQSFINVILEESHHLDKVYELMIAADYMAISSLVALCGNTLASLAQKIKYDSIEDIFGW